MPVKLKVIPEQTDFGAGWACGSRGPEEQDVLSKQQENINAIRKLLQSLKERYGDKLDVSVVDSRDPFVLWYALRYGAWATVSTWILNRKKIFKGIPQLEELERLIDAELERQ